MTAEKKSAFVDRFARKRSPVVRLPLARRTVIFVTVALIAYSVWLIVLIPAQTVIPQSDKLRVSGTLWRGEAVYASALRIEWTWAPFASLTSLAFNADWRVSGNGTDVTGRVASQGGVYRFSHVRGVADGSLLDIWDDAPPIRCRFVADVVLDRLVIGGNRQEVQGRLRTSPATCVPRGMASGGLMLPEMQGDIVSGELDSHGALFTRGAREPMFGLQMTRGGQLGIWPTAHAIFLAPPLAGWRYAKNLSPASQPVTRSQDR